MFLEMILIYKIGIYTFIWEFNMKSIVMKTNYNNFDDNDIDNNNNNNLCNNIPSDILMNIYSFLDLNEFLIYNKMNILSKYKIFKYVYKSNINTIIKPNYGSFFDPPQTFTFHKLTKFCFICIIKRSQIFDKFCVFYVVSSQNQ